MTEADDALAEAIRVQMNAEIAAANTSIKALAAKIGLPYDSTRNYLIGERPMKLGTFLEMCSGLGVNSETVIARARERMPQ